MVAPGTRLRISLTGGGPPLRQRDDQVADGTRISERRILTAVEFDRRGHGPWPGQLDLERARVPLGCLLHRVQVLREQAGRPALLPAGPQREPPAARAGLDRHIDE